MPAEKLGKVWADFINKTGPLKSYTVTRVEGNTVYISCKFERGDMWAAVSFGGMNKIDKLIMSGHPM
jgi:ribosomal protein RSM22 (predicted rRNA methylase)